MTPIDTARILTRLLWRHTRATRSRPDGHLAKPAPTGGGTGRGSAIAADDHEKLAMGAREESTRRPMADRLRQVADQMAGENGGQ